MTLKRLAIHNLRNLQSVDIPLSERINLFFGCNGSGKTSLLEAISVLGLGRSFRTHKHKPLINHQQSAYTVFGQIDSDGTMIPLGVKRQANGEAVYKANGALVPSAAALAAYLPLQIFNADSYLLLEGSPKVRRQFIDWQVFHVEPEFFQAWKDHQRCLKHRNSLLRRDRIDRFELTTWDQELVQLTERLHHFREESLTQFAETFSTLSSEFVGIEGIELGYHRGWDKSLSYAEVLDAAFEGDRSQGFTRLGSHRADLKIVLNGSDAAEVLSRGQQKLLVSALKVAQGLLFSRLTGRKCIYLIDDLPAELDAHHRALLARWLDAMQTQVFITGVDKSALIEDWQDKPAVSIKLFHVEQGEVIQQPL